MAKAQDANGSRAAEILGAGLFVSYAAIVLIHQGVPRMTDFANWTYQGALLARHLRGIADAAHALKRYPVPNSAATLGIGLLAWILPVTIAAKLWLCVQMGVAYAALRHLARMAAASGAVWGIVPQAAFFGANWWYGFVNFELGLAWVLLVASMLLRRVRGEPGRDGMLGLLLVLAFFTHMIPFAFCGLLVLLFAWQTGCWRTAWQLVPAGALTVWYLAGRYLQAGDADGRAGMVETVRDYSAAFWVYKANSYCKSFGFVNPSSYLGSMALPAMGRGPFLVLIAVDLALASMVGWLLYSKFVEVWRTKAPERFLWVGMLALVPVFLLAPGTALGVSDPGSRLLQTALVLGLPLVCRGGGSLLRAASVCGAVLSVAGLLVFARIQLGPAVPEGYAGLPTAVVQFAHAPFDDQDYFLGALDRGNYSLSVFPTGMFLNRDGRLGWSYGNAPDDFRYPGRDSSPIRQSGSGIGAVGIGGGSDPLSSF